MERTRKLANKTAQARETRCIGSLRRYLSRALVCTLLLLGSAAVQAQATDCSSFPNATLHGFADPNPPPSTQFVSTAKWNFGTYEIATQ